MGNLGRIGEIAEVRRSTGQLCLEWRIPRFLSLRSANYFHSYESPRFSFLDDSWYMRMYPLSWLVDNVRLDLCRLVTNTSTKPKGSVSVGPSLDTVPLAESVYVTVGIKGTAGVEKKTEGEHELANCGAWIVWHCCSRTELRQRRNVLMPNDDLTITCEINTSGFHRDQPVPVHKKEEVKVFTEEGQSSEKEAVEELQSSLRSLLKSGEDCDVTIKVRGKEFRAHRCILRARSPVFQAMFAHDMLERQKNIVTLEDCDPETFPDFLQHVYSGSVGMVSTNNVLSLYLASDKYDLKTLKKECIQFMERNMTVASFCDVIALAVRHDEDELIQCATKFFCSNSLDIIKTVEWQVFLKENTTVGNELLIKMLSK